MKITIREMGAGDRAAWARMRCALWPGETAQNHAGGIDEMLASRDAFGFVAETEDGTPAGFAELAIRKYANGCEQRPVAFLEGIWVKSQFRRQGVGARLIAHIETFAAARGFRELGSDSEIGNHTSHAAHRGWGFSETERVVYFRKALKASAR
jgi:aminoglycoside 6'-N-acetyltransferase I